MRHPHFAILLLSFMSMTQVRADSKNLELDVKLTLSGDEIRSEEECLTKLASVKTTLDEVNMNLQNKGEGISFKDTTLVLKNLCNNIKKVHQERLQKEASTLELFNLAQEKPKKELTYFSAKEGVDKIWSFDVKIGGSIYSGNSNFALVEAGITTTGQFANHSLSIVTLGQYKKNDSSSNKKYSVRVTDLVDIEKYTPLNDTWGAFWDVYYNHDESKGIDTDIDVLIGLGHNFQGKYRNGKKEVLKVSLALGHRSRKTLTGQESNNPISSIRIKWIKSVSKNIDFEAVAFHKANLNNISEDYETTGKIGFSFNINNNASCGINFEQLYVNMPVANKEKNDSALKFNCRHKF